jgi:vitamin-K-epoxide reductase (warfarin-sensitive)
MMIIIILAITGLIISIYGITVERKLQQDEQYKAACDISDMVSCSRPMLSPYNTMLGISNIWASACYYLVIIAIVLLNQPQLLMLITSAGVIVSIVFAYILYVKIRSLCLICTSLYIINVALAISSYFCYSSL